MAWKRRAIQFLGRKAGQVAYRRISGYIKSKFRRRKSYSSLLPPVSRAVKNVRYGNASMNNTYRVGRITGLMQQLYLAHYEGSTCYQSPSAALAIPLMQMMPYEIYQMKDYYQCLKLHGISISASVISVNNVQLNSAPSNRYMRMSLSTGPSFRGDVFGDYIGPPTPGYALDRPSIIDYQSMCQMPNVHHRDFEFDNMVNGSTMHARVFPDSSVSNAKIRTGNL